MASAPQERARTVPGTPWRKCSPNSVMPIAAATTGLTTVTVASGAVRPAPR